MNARHAFLAFVAVALCASPAAYCGSKKDDYVKSVGSSWAGATLDVSVYATNSSSSQTASVKSSIEGQVRLLKSKLSAAEASLVANHDAKSSKFEVSLAGLTVYTKPCKTGKTSISFKPKAVTLFKTPPFSVFDVGFGSVKVSANGTVNFDAKLTVDLAKGSSFKAYAKGNVACSSSLTGKIKVTILWGVAAAGAGATVKFLDTELKVDLVANKSGVTSSKATIAGNACKLFILVWAEGLWSLFGLLEWEDVVADFTWGKFSIKLF